MKNSIGLFALAATTLLNSINVFAEDSSASIASPTSMSSQESINVSESNGLDRLYLNYFGIFHGPQADHLDSPFTVDKAGKASKSMGMFFDSEVTAAYLITPAIGVGPTIPFLLSPVLGQGFTIGDAGIKAFDKKAISTKDLTVYANFIIQAPTSASSRDRGMQLGLKATPNIRYTVPSSRFTVGAWTEAKAYLGVDPNAKDKKSFKIYGAPYVNYQLNQNFSLNLEYEAEARHDRGMLGAANFYMYQTDIQPGFIYMINHKILINPYAQIFTGNNVSDKVALGAVISASL